MSRESPWPYRFAVFGSAVLSALIGRAAFGSDKKDGGEMSLQMGQRYREIKIIVDKWTQLLIRVPSTVVLAIASQESGFNPSAINLSAKDGKRGGAWGLMQITAETAADVIKELKNSGNLLIAATLTRFNSGDAHTLLDPDLNVLLGIGYLNMLAKAFNNDTTLVIAAYNRGRAGVEALLRSIGKTGIADLEYVRHVTAVRKQLESVA